MSALTLSKPHSIHLIVPHQNEHPAVLPFQRALAARLRSEGIRTKVKIIDNTVERAVSLRGFQAGRKTPAKIACAHVLFLEDRLLRTRLMEKAVSGSENVFVLELHASPAFDPRYAPPLDFKFIPGTKILVGKTMDGIQSALQDMSTMRFAYYYNKKKLFSIMQEAARLRGFSLREAIDELKELAVRLMPHSNFLQAVELPAKRIRQPEQARKSPKGNDFEIYYCTHTLQNFNFGSHELEKVAALALVPAAYAFVAESLA